MRSTGLIVCAFISIIIVRASWGGQGALAPPANMALSLNGLKNLRQARLLVMPLDEESINRTGLTSARLQTTLEAALMRSRTITVAPANRGPASHGHSGGQTASAAAREINGLFRAALCVARRMDHQGEGVTAEHRRDLEYGHRGNSPRRRGCRDHQADNERDG